MTNGTTAPLPAVISNLERQVVQISERRVAVFSGKRAEKLGQKDLLVRLELEGPRGDGADEGARFVDDDPGANGRRRARVSTRP